MHKAGDPRRRMHPAPRVKDIPRKAVPAPWQCQPGAGPVLPPSPLVTDPMQEPGSYFVQLMVGSGKPSASHTRVTDWPRLAVAFTMLCLAWTVGGTEGKKGCQGRL